ncbi:MAG: FHA domain-containing protein [Sphingobacteriales bacterium]|nr:MAG: FHA domain-containing protein [Sphingobacteriales bacterium]
MLFNLFKSDANDRPTDIKGVRHALLQFIKQELQKAEGGEGNNIKGLILYLSADADQRHLYESAVYTEEPDKFRDEIQRIADDYALELPQNWTLEVIFEQDVPPEAVKATHIDAAFFVKTSKHYIKQTAAAYVTPLSGETTDKEYRLTSEDGKINIGRDKKAQSDEGYFRMNVIAFPSDSANPANRYVSRQHAHIEWNDEAGKFMLFADEGGVPPRNKVKVRSETTEEIIKLHSDEIGHELQEGDQIILGESAVLLFSYQPATS